MTNHQAPVGIDLGTTCTVVAFLDRTGRPTIVPNRAGDLLTPSAVFVDQSAIAVGKEAVRAAVTDPRRYADGFKRDVGAPAFRRPVAGHEVPPEILSAFVLDWVKRDAERQIGLFREVVLTVPAYFDERRRRATRTAGRLAGLEVVDIINEPTAAAVAFGYQQGIVGADCRGVDSRRQKLLVYDLGGGTFDVTLLEIDGHQFRTLATDGDVRLGGRDFDRRLVDHVAERFLDAHGVDPRGDVHDAAQLWFDAEAAKRSLSELTKTTIVCAHAGIRMPIDVTRSDFEQWTADLLARTEMTVSLVIRQAGVGWDDIDRVILTGGATRMPMVRDMLRGVTGKEPDASLPADEAVARGAAVYAGMLAHSGPAEEHPTCTLINVNSHSLGVVGTHHKTGRKENVVLIPKNTPLPCRAAKRFQTAKDNQRTVRVAIVEGESERPEECIALGECVIRRLPPHLPAKTAVEVEYRYAADGCLSVVARAPAIRHSASVTINRRGADQAEDIEQWRTRLLGQEVFAASGTAEGQSTVNLGDRCAILRRLDNLYLRVGQMVLDHHLPSAVRQYRLDAVEVAEQLRKVERRVKKLQRAAEATSSLAEAAHRGAALGRAKSDLQRLRAKAEFAYLLLGRQCVDHNCLPPGAAAQAAEIGQLRARFDQIAAQ